MCSKPRESGRSYRCRKQREQPFSWYNEWPIADRVTDMTWYVSIFNSIQYISVILSTYPGVGNWNFQDRRKVLLSSLTDQLKQVLARTVFECCMKMHLMKNHERLSWSHGWLDEDPELCNTIRQGSDMQWSCQRLHLTVGYICFVQDQWSCYVGSKSGAAPGTAGKMKGRSVFNSYHAVMQWYCILSSQSAKLEKPHDRPFWASIKDKINTLTPSTQRGTV